MTACPSDDVIGALADGLLPETERVGLEEHVARCAECASMVAELAMLVIPSASGSVATIGRYELAEPLGTGGMGIVVEAFDPLLSRRVAIKVVRPDKAISRARVLAEARALATLSDPHVLTIHDVIDSERGICIVTELVDGENADVWRQRCRPTWPQIRALYLDVARGLVAVHAHGLLHRDIKPTNIFVGRDGRPRIGDFGLVTDTSAAVGGTVGFMPPEQVGGKTIDVRADQFALAVSMVHAATGDLVAAGTSAARLPTSIPLADRTVLARALSARPDDRYERITDFVAAFAPTPRSRRPYAIAAALAVASVAVAAPLLRSDDKRPSPAPSPAVAVETHAPIPTEDAAVVAMVVDAPPVLDATVAINTHHRASADAAVPAPAERAEPTNDQSAIEDDLVDAIHALDGPGCTRALDKLVALDPAFERQRTTCEMISGHCKAAMAKLEPADGAATLGIAMDYCPPDGDLDKYRVGRAAAQGSRGRSLETCKHRATWVKTLAKNAEEAEQYAMYATECFVGARLCDEALAEAGVLAGIRGTTAAAELKRVSPMGCQ
ncbi:MAG TPA: protein kinase [Kofleriaceae bacterium]